MFREAGPETAAKDQLVLSLCGEELILLAEKALYWPSQQTLFVADCHFGKVAHFRRAGIGLPQEAGLETFADLHKLLHRFPVQRLVILGDAFHSEANQDTERFRQWRLLFPDLELDLVLGNHDLASLRELRGLGVNLFPELEIGPFTCRHDPPAEPENGRFYFFGHLHPGVSLSLGRTHVKVPCFWKGSHFLCFPAFGRFTGSVAVNPADDDELFGLTPGKIHRIKGHWLK
jgi:DNA ligase-associated metallophosphoesterase